MQASTALSLITLLIAIYGAVLGTLSYRRQHQRWLRVSLSFGFKVFGPELSDQQIIVTVANPSNKTVSVAGVGILLPDRSQAFIHDIQPGVSIPHDLWDGKSFSAFLDCKGLDEVLLEKGFSGQVALVPFAIDGTGTKHFGKPAKIAIDSRAKRRAGNA